MTAPAPQVDLQFINMTNDPSVGKDERRIYVRRTVMTEYHKRIKRQKNDVNRPPEKPILDDTVEPPGVTHPRPAGLLQPKSWANADHDRISKLIIRFLHGQAAKASRDLSDVSFIHSQLKDVSTFSGADRDTLRLCQQTLRSHCDSSTTERAVASTLWEDVHFQQERIYIQVGLILPGGDWPFVELTHFESNSWDAWELLSAAQTMTLYVLLRLKRYPHHPTCSEGDIALLFTLGVSASISKVKMKSSHNSFKLNNARLMIVE